MSYIVIFRGKRACPCHVKWIPAFEAELRKRGLIQSTVDIAQLIGGAPASGGTHSTGGAIDIWQRSYGILRCARDMGADASWGRTTAQGFTPHAHLVLRGCPHNSPARYQINAVDAGYNGLGYMGRGGRDDGPRPLSGLTWQQGIERYQGDTDMTPAQAKKLDDIHRWSREIVIAIRDMRPGRKNEYSDGVQAAQIRALHRTFSPGGQLRGLLGRVDAALAKGSALQDRVFEMHRSLSPKGQLRNLFLDIQKKVSK